jgi:citronellyl-CoA dehydrogenase
VQFTAEHEALRASVRDLVEREINPHVDEWERAGRFPAHELFPVLAKIGLLGLEYDPAYGGEGADHSFTVAAGEELGRIDCGGVGPCTVTAATSSRSASSPRRSAGRWSARSR